MKITPLEIRQKTFEKNFRGYEKDEVHAFLLTLSQEWEKMQDENKELRLKLESSEREVQKLREVESSLYKTLKTAEDTGANVIEQARRAADLHLKESQLRAEALMNETKNKAKDTLDESEMRAKQVIADMEDRLKSLLDNYQKLESSREDLLGDLKRLGSDLLDKVERAKQSHRDFDADKHFYNVRKEAKKIVFPNQDFERTPKPEARIEPLQVEKVVNAEPIIETIEPRNEPKIVHKLEPEVAEPVMQVQPKKVQRSFFDEIG
jgi:cell division initiation protein